MVRGAATSGGGARGAPHPRGDGPPGKSLPSEEAECSPPAWGWSDVPVELNTNAFVLPTRVGMVRLRLPLLRRQLCAPHPRGDGPGAERRLAGHAEGSPPAWGWSDYPLGGSLGHPVLPTRVGMVRISAAAMSPQISAPRPRGRGADCGLLLM